jgi:hypothetical protein
MSLLDKLKEAIEFDSIEVEVPAWGETFFVTPLSVQELSKLQKRFPDFLINSSVEAAVELIMMKAMNKDGEKAFTLEHKPLLLRQRATIIMQFYGVLVGSVLQEDPEKNLETTRLD